MFSAKTVCACGLSGRGHVRCAALLWSRLLAAGRMEPRQPTFRSTEPQSDSGVNDLLNLHFNQLLWLLWSYCRKSLSFCFVFSPLFSCLCFCLCFCFVFSIALFIETNVLKRNIFQKTKIIQNKNF